MTGPAISVLTPTYNRAHVLPRVYESLQRQTVRDFEWVVVDDGSTDETPVLLARWQAEADFPVTWYRYTSNRGRNAAVNSGAALISGDYTLVLDSDDALLDDALEAVGNWRSETGVDEIEGVYNLAFRCVDQHNSLIGTLSNCRESNLPSQVMRVSATEAKYRLRMTFEFIGVLKTEIFQRNEFVELTESEHCPEEITHNAAAGQYETIYIDRPVRIYYRGDGVSRLSDKSSGKSIKWPRGNYLRALAILNRDIGYLRHNPKVFMNAARKITRLGLHIGRSPRSQFRDLAHARARLLWVAGMPGGFVGWLRDRLHGRRAPKADPDISAWGPAAPPESGRLHPPPQRFRRQAPAASN